jgi:hypothetical protein|tara:strand:- start:1075 stop:1350 length:276 start_codon:yes stop_codon:yes gene_type:complete
MQVPTVMNMKSSRSGKKVKNQFLICTDKGQYFQSYRSIIAFKDNAGNVTLDRNRWDYSVTTGKYRNQFLRMNKAETEKAIKAGQIKLEDLN